MSVPQKRWRRAYFGKRKQQDQNNNLAGSSLALFLEPWGGAEQCNFICSGTKVQCINPQARMARVVDTMKLWHWYDITSLCINEHGKQVSIMHWLQKVEKQQDAGRNWQSLVRSVRRLLIHAIEPNLSGVRILRVGRAQNLSFSSKGCNSATGQSQYHTGPGTVQWCPLLCDKQVPLFMQASKPWHQVYWKPDKHPPCERPPLLCDLFCLALGAITHEGWATVPAFVWKFQVDLKADWGLFCLFIAVECNATCRRCQHL